MIIYLRAAKKMRKLPFVETNEQGVRYEVRSDSRLCRGIYSEPSADKHCSPGSCGLFFLSKPQGVIQGPGDYCDTGDRRIFCLAARQFHRHQRERKKENDRQNQKATRRVA